MMMMIVINVPTTTRVFVRNNNAIEKIKWKSFKDNGENAQRSVSFVVITHWAIEPLSSVLFADDNNDDAI